MLGMRTFRGAVWLVSSRLAGRLIDFVTLLVLARALNPADFGLVAVAMTLIAVVDIVLEIPLTQALTRLSQVRKSHLDTAFTLGILRSLLLATIILLAAWPFALIYNDNRLISLLAVLAIGPISRGLYSPSMVTFVRDISFRRVFIAELCGKCCGAVFAILMVYFGYGYWSIAVNGVIAASAMTVTSYFLAPYRPALSLAEWPDFSKFMGWFSIAQLVAALNWQFDRVLLGHFVSKASLGRYALASDLAAMPVQSLISPAMTSVLAALSAVNSDRERLRNAYLKASRFTMILAAPMCLGVSLTSDLIVNILLGTKWAESALYLQWLGLTMVLIPFSQPLYNLALATNRPDAAFRLNIIELSFRCVLVSSGLYLGSILGVIAARGTVSIIMFVAAVFLARNLVGVSIRSQINNLREVVVAAIAMMTAVVLLRYYSGGITTNPYLELAFASGVGALVYGSVLHVLGIRFIQVSNGVARVRIPGVV
jgi:O-antigen/teichoic acid export membrane protein